MSVSAVKISEERDVYAVNYDIADVLGDEITATFQNPEDKSVYAGLNDGSFIVTVGKGYVGDDEVLVEGSEGGSDVGTVTFA